MTRYVCRPSFRYAEMNELVEIVRDTGDVWLCENKKGRFPCHKSWLKDEPVEVQEPEKIVKPKEIKRAYTQAEKLQLEYLNSKK